MIVLDDGTNMQPLEEMHRIKIMEIFKIDSGPARHVILFNIGVGLGG